MRTLFVLLLITAATLSADELTLRDGRTLRPVTILSIDHRTVRIADASGTEQTFAMSEVESVLQQSAADSTADRVILRNGTTLTGTVTEIRFDAVSILLPAGDTVTVTPTDAVRVTGRRSALAYQSVDGHHLFLTNGLTRFVGGRPRRGTGDPRYHFLVSLGTSLPMSSFTYSAPGVFSTPVKTGYGIGFSLDAGISPGNALSFSYRFLQHTITTPDSLPGAFTEWSSHLLSLGVKRTATVVSLLTVFGEAKIGYGTAMLPEHQRLTVPQSSGVTWSVGGGIFVTDRISVDAVYLTFSPKASLTYTSSSPSFTTQELSATERVSALFIGLSYHITGEE